MSSCNYCGACLQVCLLWQTAYLPTNLHCQQPELKWRSLSGYQSHGLCIRLSGYKHEWCISILWSYMPQQKSLILEMVTNSTACVCICSVGTSTCWSWTVPIPWTDCYTCSLSRILSCPLLTKATYSMAYTSLPFSSHHCCQVFAYHRIYWGVWMSLCCYF